MKSTKKPHSEIQKFTEKYTDKYEATIFNLSEYKTDKFNSANYEHFLEFYNQTNNQLDNEIKNGEGNIIDLFKIDGLDENEKLELDNIKEEYYNMYIKPLDDKKYRYPSIKKFQNKNLKYPHFLKDLHGKSNIIYQKYEELLGLPKDKITEKPIRIEEQNDEELMETLKLRIDGLLDCQKYKPESQEDNEKQYYNDQYEREYKKYQEVLNNIDLSPSKKIEEICKNIFYNQDAYNKYYKKTYDFNKITELLTKNNGIEELYSRTFLPIEIFDKVNEVNKNYKLNYDKLNELLDSGDRNNRQFIFGFYSDDFLKSVRELKPFIYEAGGMIYKKNYNDSCNLLVNWSIFLNMLYCRCGIANETPLCPTRFILPFDIIKPIIKNQNNEIITEFNIRDKLPLLDLFDENPDTNAKFLGIISIKYYHEETNKIRIWYIFIFKNNNLEISNRQNSITGMREKIILCNYQLRQINMYGLFAKHNIIHYELLHYIYLSRLQITDTRKIYFYIPLGTNDNKTIFISKHADLESKPILDDLQLQKINITMIDKYDNKHQIPETLIKLTYQTKNNIPFPISGGSYSINNYRNNYTFEKINHIRFSTLIHTFLLTYFIQVPFQV